MNRNVLLALSVLLFAGILVPINAQTADHVVINEVDINPLGDDFHLFLNGLNCTIPLILILI